MAESHHRKLAAMGIASWVSTGRPEVLGRLNTEIFNLWLDVFGEIKEALAETGPEDSRQVFIIYQTIQILTLAKFTTEPLLEK
jgi:hypothetical protein